MSEIQRPREQIISDNEQHIREEMARVGYASVASLEELGLTPEQIQQLRHVNLKEPCMGYFQTGRPDGTRAQAVTQAQPNRYVAANVFSPGLVGGRAANNDFQWEELERILREAKDNPAR